MNIKERQEKLTLPYEVKADEMNIKERQEELTLQYIYPQGILTAVLELPDLLLYTCEPFCCELSTRKYIIFISQLILIYMPIGCLSYQISSHP